MEHIMRFSRLGVLWAALLILFAEHLFCEDTEDRGRLDQNQEELEERDWDALRQYLRSRREVEKEQSKSALLISGDVRGDWRNKEEVLKFENLLGGDAVDGRGVRRGRNKFDIEANLRFDYDLEKSWAVLHLQYDNKAGIDDEVNCVEGSGENLLCFCDEMFGSGSCGDLCLKQAYFGYNLYKCGDTEFDVEIGRRNLYHVFDSKVQFLSRFDGILFSYDDSIKNYMDYYYRIAGFVVDYKVNHFAWVTEAGILNICDSGLDLKYSFIDWRKNGVNRCSSRIDGCTKVECICGRDKKGHRKRGRKIRCGRHDPPGARFMISQWTASYEWEDKCVFKEPMRIFGAYLYNYDDADPNACSMVPKENVAWYMGYRIGEVKKADDWAFQVMYQWVEAYSVPDLDMSGIGNGNTNDTLIITEGVGNTNFKGWRFDGLYAFTDEISINARCEWSTEINRKICNGGRHYYRGIKVEMIYAF